MVNVGVVGTGFVGLTHAAVTAMFGHDVIGYDYNEEKVKSFNSGVESEIEKYICEKGLADLVIEQLKSGRLSFTTNPEKLSDRQVIFMCLPTPYREDGSSNLSYLLDASETVVRVLSERHDFVLIVNKSTVPIGTAAMLNEHIYQLGLRNFEVASNPEFLPEGDAVQSAIHAHKVIIGAHKHESFELLREIYSVFVNSQTYIETNPETAEAIKYASNALLYIQIVTWQAIPGTIGEGFPLVNFDTVKRGMLADKRISGWGSYLSAGAGGSCF